MSTYTISLPNGYNGDVVECDATPLKVDGDFVKLSVKGSHMIRWCQKSDWEAAVAMQARSQEDAADEPEEDQSQGYRM
jgi:hypothetical protein